MNSPSIIRRKLSIHTIPTSVPVKTKVICTIGPGINTVEKLAELMYHGSVIANVRAAAAKVNKPVAIMLDTMGPEIRTGKLEGGKPVDLRTGQPFTIFNTLIVGDSTKCGVTYNHITQVLSAGSDLLIDDGLIALVVNSVHSDRLECTVKNGGLLGETKGVNLPNCVVDLPAVTARDRKDIEFGIEQGIDAIAASFVRQAENVREIRSILTQILHESDGIMVARGDLGVEIPIQKIAMAQKLMISQCNAVGKPVITATQMLESMIKNPRPTRAETTDVCNAVLDGSDCVMLSGETAKGDYPVECVQLMVSICRETEAGINYVHSHKYLRRTASVSGGVSEVISATAVKAAEEMGAKLMVVLTETGATARHVAKYRPSVPILCINSHDMVARQCQFSRGVIPFTVDSMIGTDAIVLQALAFATSAGLCQSGDIVVLVSGYKEGIPGQTNMIKKLIAP